MYNPRPLNFQKVAYTVQATRDYKVAQGGSWLFLASFLLSKVTGKLLHPTQAALFASKHQFFTYVSLIAWLYVVRIFQTWQKSTCWEQPVSHEFYVLSDVPPVD